MEDKRLYFKKPFITDDQISYEQGKFYMVPADRAAQFIADGVAVDEGSLNDAKPAEKAAEETEAADQQ